MLQTHLSHFVSNSISTPKTEHQPKKMLLFLLSLLFLSPHLTFSLTHDGLVLLQAKSNLSDPTHFLSSWNARDPTPCNWTGVTCNSASGLVTALDLSTGQLAGIFPDVLCRLPGLSYLSLYDNFIGSSIAAVDFSACTNLTTLILSSNYLVGPVPSSLSRIPNLQHLDLSANNFSGGIPASFAEFRNLETLSLAGNFINGTVPSFLGNLTSLRELSLAYNPFSPSEIPSELGNLTNLEVLWLAGCNLVGHIPPSLTRLTRLWNLDLSLNRLTGLIPSSINEMKGLVQIELFNNSLSGELPERWSNLTNFRRLDASMNQLVGAIPEELCALSVDSLVLYDNRLYGSLPASIARSPNLLELKLFNNKLSGKLPSDLGKNSPLNHVDVSYNGFSGEIPNNLCAKGALEELIMIYNEFSGEIPASLGQCHSLSRVRLRNNKLSGSVPEDLWGLPHVYLLELVENSLSGNVSNKVSGAYNLSVLLLSKNQFSGSIPDGIGSLSNLVEFSGDENRFSGEIPGSLVKLSQLAKLDLSANELSGGLPDGVQGWKKLNELNLANNSLSGNIPNEIGSLPVLNYLDLSMNHFSGRIPTELQDLNLNVLNLSSNSFSGDIPPLYANEGYKDSFLGNPGLCGDISGLCDGKGEGKNEGYMWILRSIFILAGLVFVVGILWFYLKYRRFKTDKNEVVISKWRSFHKLGFSEYEIVDCLKEDNVIGSGGSGKVYKVVTRNNEVVAVKKLWGAIKKEEGLVGSEKDGFEVEVETLGKIRHKNIVRLWCCCNTNGCKLLVYEYMSNGSLGDLLHSSKGGMLDWPRRLKIALGAAEGLSYLHHDCVPPIVHRDVKSNNILLDEDFGAKVADFGLAKIVQGLGNGAEPMSVIAGSCGYIAPEYAYTLQVNEKSDIYSFGVVILELVTGRLPTDPEFGENDLVKWVCTTLEQKGIEHVLDSKLDSIYNHEIHRVLNIGLLCTSSLPINRPSMRRVVKMLQEAGGAEMKPKTEQKDGKLSPYYYEDSADQASSVEEFGCSFEAKSRTGNIFSSLHNV